MRSPKNNEVAAVEPKREQNQGTGNTASGAADQGSGEYNKDNQYILVALELRQKDDRNPLSAQQALRDPVKTYKLELAKPNEADFSSKSQLKSPTRCANTATTSGNIGSLTRAEGDILVR